MQKLMTVKGVNREVKGLSNLSINLEIHQGYDTDYTVDVTIVNLGMDIDEIYATKDVNENELRATILEAEKLQAQLANRLRSQMDITLSN